MKPRKSPTDQSSALYSTFHPIVGAGEKVMFAMYGPGVETQHDAITYDFSRTALAFRVKQFADDYDLIVHRLKDSKTKQDIARIMAASKLPWSDSLRRHAREGRPAQFDDSKIVQSLFRPFVKKFHYCDEVLNERTGFQCRIYGPTSRPVDNVALVCTCHPQRPFSAIMTNCVTSGSVGGRPGTFLPFFVYDEDGTHRRENITDWALDQFRTHYNNPVISKWSIFDYVYGLLHHPGYRATFADQLKRELPRIPFAPDFRALQRSGQQLIRLHLDYDQLAPWDLQPIETPGVPLTHRVQKMRLSKDKSSLTINDSLTLASIPPSAIDYRIGNCSAVEWVMDQYQIREDKRSGVISDPNRQDDPQYIVKLVGQVIRVSVETAGIVNALPPEFADAVAAA